MQELQLDDTLFPSLLAGSKVGTARKGQRKIELDKLLLTATRNTEKPCVVDVERVSYTKVKDITDADASMDGYATAKDLVNVMRKYYPDIDENETITIIRFVPGSVKLAG